LLEIVLFNLRDNRYRKTNVQIKIYTDTHYSLL